jgi:type 1 glutamine amidotransferase
VTSRRWFFVLLPAIVAVASASQVPSALPTRRLLYVTHSAAFKHSVLPTSEGVVSEIGRSSGAFTATVTQDCSLISADSLRQYDAVFFYTTGELPISDQQKQALMDFIRGGKGFVGAHSATDTFYKWPEYGDMIGGYFNDHPWRQEVVIKVEDQNHPATKHLPATFKLSDEIYQFKDWSRSNVHVLLSLDTSSVDLKNERVKRTDGDFALAWTKSYGKGRVFYTALGHEEFVWQDPRFQQHLLGGIKWAMGME